MSSKAISAEALGGEADTIAAASSLQPLDANVLASSTAAAAPAIIATPIMPTTTPSLPSSSLAASAPASDENAKLDQQVSAEASSSSLVPPPPPSSGPDRATTGLHSPPDSNNASKLDGSSSDSELSDLDDDALAETLRCMQPEDVDATLTSVTTPTAAAADTVYAACAVASDATPAAAGPCPSATPASDDKPASADAPAAAEDEDDIGEVEPDHYSGTVPVFRPTMHQFRDFKKFVRSIPSPTAFWLISRSRLLSLVMAFHMPLPPFPGLLSINDLGSLMHCGLLP
jgi:hypothetical protein